MKTQSVFITIIIGFIIIVLMPNVSYGQQEYFYSTNGQKVYMDIAEDRLVVKPAASLTAEQVTQALGNSFTNTRVEEVTGLSSKGFYEIRFDSGSVTKQQLATRFAKMRTDNAWEMVNPVYLIEGSPAIVYDIFVVNLRDESGLKELEELNKKYGVELVDRNELVPTMITLRLPEHSEHQVTELARLYYESLSLEWSTPDFKQETVLHGIPNDPYYQYQFYMDMISAADAWDISLGDETITVAVVDEGVEGHPDLPASQLVNGYDAFGQTGGAPGGNQAHGMASAGIIGANHNPQGVAGLSPNIEIMPVRIYDEKGEGTSDGNKATAMTHAVTNGADIINNSWGYGGTGDVNPQLTTVIENAMQNGRGGDGTIIIFSSGNTISGGAVRYPANIDGVIAVGAVEDDDTVWWYSCRGPELDLVAPSGDFLGYSEDGPCGQNNEEFGLIGNVWSLDRNNNPGWNPGDYQTTSPNCFHLYTWSTHTGQPAPADGYTAHFAGTSAAAPQVSGTAALMLSINPDLTLDQLRDVLHNTADEVAGMNGQTPTNEYGHGRLNAYEAVKEALPSQYDGNLFATNTTLNSAHIYGTDFLNDVTLTVPQDKVVVLEGNIYGATGVKFEIDGKVIINEDAVVKEVNFNVNDGGELIIQEGAEINLGDDGWANIRVRAGGKITAKGTEDNPIVIQRASSGTAWGRVMLNSSAGNHFEWVLFDGGTENVWIASKNNTFKHCTFKNGWRGITGWPNQDGSGNASATISYALVEDNTSVGVVSHYLDLDMSYTTIQNNTQAGLYIISSSVNPFHHNLITGNGGSTRDGIEVKSSGSLWMHTAYSEDGYNEVHNNGEDQISTSGDLLVGTYPYPGTQNAIYGNCTGSRYLIENNSGVYVDAYNTYWNCTSGSSMFNSYLVDDGNHLGSNPTDSVPHGYGGQAPKAVTSPFNFNEAYEDALTRLNQAEDIQEIRNQLYKLYQIAGLSKDEALKDQFNTLVASAAQGTEVTYASSTLNTAFQQIASIFYGKSLIRDERYGQASTLLDERNVEELSGYDRRDYYHLKAVTETYHGEYEMALSTLEDLYAFQGTQEVDMEEFRAGYSTFEEDIRARMEEGGGQDQRATEPAGSEQEAEQLALQNYPNPFNPVTNIRFTLPERGQVSLVVYDMLGREVATLVNNILPAGEQTARFDASNLANGVYLYKLRAGNQEIIRKMTLIK